MNTTIFGGVRITLFGHASVCFEYRETVVYVDPYVVPSNAKPANLILHTHPHHDHCAEARKITNSGTTIIGHGCKHACRPIEIGEKVAFQGIVIEAVHAYNLSKPFHIKGAGAGYLLTFGQGPGSARIYVAGDTDHTPEMDAIKCDVAMLPIGGTYTMDVPEAARAAVALKPKVLIPLHYNYLSELKADPNELRRLCMEFGCGCDVRILIP